MATEQQIDIPPATDEDRAIATVTMAFTNDPVARWVLRDPDLYLTYWPRVVKAYGAAAFAKGTADSIDDGGGVALWLPPGRAGRRDDAGTRGRGRPCRRTGRGLRLHGPDGASSTHRTALGPAVYRRRRHQAEPRIRLGAASPCARTLRPGSTARLPRCHEPTEQAAVRAPRIRRARGDPEGSSPPSSGRRVGDPELLACLRGCGLVRATREGRQIRSSWPHLRSPGH
jgi:hypothetical protein